jgi:FtsP/CotA-like multicopper oxidase with cupredoxin domain
VADVRPISRRRALHLGALGAAGVVVGAVGLSQTGPPAVLPTLRPRTRAGDPLAEPPMVHSEQGILRTELEITEQEVELAGRRAVVQAYNGSVPGPTFRVRPGDRLQVRLINRIDAPTNLHTHGLHVSPEGNSDNPFLSIGPGESFDYEFALPADHPPGTYWYHPHRHGLVADQIFAGLYGAIVIDDDVAVTRERLLIVSDISLRGDDTVRPPSRPEVMMGREGDLLMVNGQAQPEISMRPGERERWRIINACTSRYLRLALDGQQVHLLGTDIAHLPRPEPVEQVLLSPGNRADLLVTAQTGTSELRTLGYDRGRMMGMMGGDALSGPALLATVRVEGAQVADGGPIPEREALPDLRDRAPVRRRDVEFTMGMGRGMGMRGALFGFDGREFDHHRVDQQVNVDTVEEWTIHNSSPMDHPFHLHVWPVQVIEEHGQQVTEPTWRDVVNVPAGGRVTVRVAFDTFGGRTVYHCHILDHEDLGMMAVIDAA